MKRILMVIVFTLCAHPVWAELPRAFLTQYCVKCHGSSVQKADRRFDQFSETIANFKELELWQDIVDQLNLQSMPPKRQMQPGKDEVLATVQVITASIAEARMRLSGERQHTPLRRLNAWEYRQTLGDLLGLNMEAWDPTEDFPPEVKVKGFDNNAAGLVTSGLLLDHYLRVAEEAVTRATHFEARPEAKNYVQKSPFYFTNKQANSLSLPKVFREDRFRFVSDTGYDDLTGRHYRGGHIGFYPLANGGAPVSGTYTIRVQAAAIDRNHHYDRELNDFPKDDPLVLELAAVDRKGSVQSTGNISREYTLATVELTREEPQWFEWDVYLEKGFEPEVRFRNGTLATKVLVRKLTKAKDPKPEILPFVDQKAGNIRNHALLKVYRGPKLRVWEIQVSGPQEKDWPPRGHQLMYGDLKPEDLDQKRISERLRAFATAAFRRPLHPGELAPFESLVHEKLSNGMAPLTALQLGFQAILSAPAFLFLHEGEGALDDYSLSARLSYFLWSSAPDDELIALAQQKKLSDPAMLNNQIHRMLKDAKSQRFVKNFIRVWLNYDNIGEMPPSPDFRVYFRDNLGPAMVTETETFFRHVLDNNLSPREFLSADYSFLNRELARHYGIEDIEGDHFRRVPLTGTPRGGLLGQGSFLMASANGVDTSPVVRGIYVLENVLGYTPPPPPDDVPEIEPDTRGATTIRDQLVKHREMPTCAQCHSKIDPPGFALENFDAIGGWRTHYTRSAAIDPSGQLPNGEAFQSFVEFRELMTKRHAEFTRCLTEKLLTYAIGRELGISDRPAIDAIVQDVQEKNKSLRDLITLVILSDPFKSN